MQVEFYHVCLNQSYLLYINKIKEITVDIKDYPKTDIGVTNLTNLFGNITGLIKGITLPATELSSVSITYSYDLPLFLHFTGLKEFNIKTKLSVLSGSGCKNNIHNRQ